MDSRSHHDQVPMMTDPTSALATFERDMLLIELLVGYARSDERVPENFTVRQLSPDHVQYLRTESGARDLRVWADSFRSTYSELLAFKAELERPRSNIPVGDVPRVNEAIETMLAGLVKWLDAGIGLKAS